MVKRLKIGIIEMLDAVLESLAVCLHIVMAAALLVTVAFYTGVSLLFVAVPGMRSVVRFFKRKRLVALRGTSDSLFMPFRKGRVLSALVVYLAGSFQVAVVMERAPFPYVEFLGGGIVLLYVILRGLIAAVRARPRDFGSGFFASLFGLRNVFLSHAPDLVRAYRNPLWTKTDKLNSMEVAALNDEFERTTAAALHSLGFAVRATGANVASKQHKGPGDGGVDVVLVDADGIKTVVSCKRYQKPVGVQDIRDIFAVSKCTDHANSRAMLVTTVGFTGPAVLFAKKNEIVISTLDRLIEASMARGPSPRKKEKPDTEPRLYPMQRAR